MKESDIEQHLKLCVEKAGGFCLKMTGFRGIPDRLVLLPGGKAIFVEVKKRDGRVSEAQKTMHKELRNRRVWMNGRGWRKSNTQREKQRLECFTGTGASLVRQWRAGAIMACKQNF